MSGASSIRLRVQVLKRLSQNWNVINASSPWHKSGSFTQKLLRMAYNHKTTRVLYKKLLDLYPPEFKEQLGESMEQSFHDLCKERQKEGYGFGFRS
jgi:hypothetical protein